MSNTPLNDKELVAVKNRHYDRGEPIDVAMVGRLIDSVEDARAERDAASKNAAYQYGEAAKLLARLDALQAIVDKLPKTADGVPVWPGMTLWSRFEINVYYVGPCYPGEQGQIVNADDEVVDAEAVYSTREAAEASRTTPTENNNG